MPRTALREELETLRNELAEGPDLDAESRELLAGLAADIERVLEDDAAAGEVPLAEQLADAAERFEASHPRLTALVGRIANALSNLGI